MTSYHKSDKKYKAREDTIIKPYCKLFGKKIPEDKQYWTICATCATEDGNILKGSELYHVHSKGFLDISQFNGVDIDKEVIRLNSKIPDAKWYNTSITSALIEAGAKGHLNPAVVNFDSINEPKIATSVLSDILLILSEYKIRNVMVVANIIMQSYGKNMNDPETITDNLYANFNFKKAMHLHEWQALQKIYTYKGSTNKSVMSSVILYNN